MLQHLKSDKNGSYNNVITKPVYNIGLLKIYFSNYNLASVEYPIVMTVQ